jgi:hypothetical protein
MADAKNPDQPMSTGTKVALGGAGLAILGGLFAAFGGNKKPATSKLGGLSRPAPRKPCGPCGR